MGGLFVADILTLLNVFSSLYKQIREEHRVKTQGHKQFCRRAEVSSGMLFLPLATQLARFSYRNSATVVMFEYLAAVSYYFTLPLNHFLFIFIFHFESLWWQGFPHWGPYNLLYCRYQVSFPGAKPSGRGVDFSTLNNAEVKNE
jgi:hypothetical protein